MDQVIAFLIGYVAGSIPFGLLLTLAAGKGDIRNIGSGNIGATNVLRTGSKGLAAGTLLLDFAKGLLAVIAARELFGLAEGLWAPVALTALGAVLGHCFPVWLKFRGGKGVATNMGVAFGLAWPIGVAYALTWLVIALLFRFSSLAGMTAVLAAVAAAATLGMGHFVPVLAVIAVVVIWMHRANISRLLAGTEPRIGSKK